jgi:16S rRNA (cytosine967-C5)-methyltransferase
MPRAVSTERGADRDDPHSPLEGPSAQGSGNTVRSAEVVQGRASRAAAAAAIEAHVAVLQGKPLRAATSEALARHEKLGGKERRFVAWSVRELSRHLRWLDSSMRAHGWAPSKLSLPEDQALLRFALWRRERCGASADRVMVEVALPGPVRPRTLPDAVLRQELNRVVVIEIGGSPLDRLAALHSFPTWLAEAIERSAPEGSLEAVLCALNREPGLSFRARPPGTRGVLLAELTAAGIRVLPCDEAPDALRLEDAGRSVFESRWVKEGRLQVMDLGSQMLGEFCGARAGQVAVDLCAGAGGKTLLLADAVGPNGRVYACDRSQGRLKDAKARASELKLRHVSFPIEPRLDLADIVLIDAPCSGTGTFAREPDQKWKLSKDKVAELQKTQLEILEKVAPKVRAGAAIVYGTCSVLRDEDETVVERFLAKHPTFSLDGAPLRVWPHRLDGGGFFGARLVKR